VYCTIIVFMGGGGGNMMFSLYFLYEFKLGVLLVVYIFKISKISKIQFRSSLWYIYIYTMIIHHLIEIYHIKLQTAAGGIDNRSFTT
jgi:hypothetical protein